MSNTTIAKRGFAIIFSSISVPGIVAGRAGGLQKTLQCKQCLHLHCRHVNSSKTHAQLYLVSRNNPKPSQCKRSLN